ncbi:MAG: hypothetical protein P8Y96_11825 [Desulfuromonadales bacterium]
MKRKLISATVLFLVAFSLSVSVGIAGDFDWTRDLNIRAEADLSQFRAQLSTRFNIGDAQVNVVLGNVDRPADAYMVLRLGEMSSRSIDYVMNKYSTEKSNGWGKFAQSLGIKPGSREFQALKQGSDIYSGKIRLCYNLAFFSRNGHRLLT